MMCFHRLCSVCFGNDNSKNAVLLFRRQETVVKLVVGLGVVFLALIGQDGFLDVFQIVRNLGMDMLAADDEAVGIVDGALGEGEVVGFLERLEVLGVDARQLHLFLEAGAEFLAEGVVVDGVNHLRFIV